jgi:hypothetical protein
MDALRLPTTLWRDGTICMPPFLQQVWRDELKSRNLYERACDNNPSNKEVFGGETAEETLSHFADRFKTSSARVAYVLLSPGGEFSPIPCNLLASLFDGPLAVLDIPCGSGGGLHGLLSGGSCLPPSSNIYLA